MYRAKPLNHNILHLFRDRTIKLNLQNGSKDKLKPTDDGKVLTLNETESDRLARWTREESELNQIVLNQCSIDMLAYMADYFQGVVAGQIEKDNLYLLTFWEYDACVDYLCNHNKGGYRIRKCFFRYSLTRRQADRQRIKPDQWSKTKRPNRSEWYLSVQNLSYAGPCSYAKAQVFQKDRSHHCGEICRRSNLTVHEVET